MNLKGTQTQMLAALGACLALVILAGPAAARPLDDGGSSNRAADEQSLAADAIVNQRQLELAADRSSVAWYLTDEYRHFVLPESENIAIENQRQLELAADKQHQVIPYLSHGMLEPEQAWEVIPYLSHGVLSASDVTGPGSSLDRPDGYQPQLSTDLSPSGIPLSAGIPEPNDLVVPGMPELGTFGNPTSDATTAVSLRDRPDGYQPQLSGSDFGVVADEGFDWTTTGFAASIIAAMLVAAAITFTRGNRHGYRSA